MFRCYGIGTLLLLSACGPGFTVVFEDSTKWSGRALQLDGTAYAWWRDYSSQMPGEQLDPGILELRFLGVRYDAHREWRRAPGAERLALWSQARASDGMSVSVLHVDGDHMRSGQWDRDDDGRTCLVPCTLEQCQELFQCEGKVDLRTSIFVPVPDREEPIDASGEAPKTAMVNRSFGTDWHLSLDQADREAGGRVAGALTLTADEDGQEEIGLRFDVPVLNTRLAGCNERSQLGSRPDVFPCEGSAP